MGCVSSLTSLMMMVMMIMILIELHFMLSIELLNAGWKLAFPHHLASRVTSNKS